MTTDLLDRAMTPQETELLDIYRRLKALESADLAPSTVSNVRVALAAVAVAVTDLALEYEHLLDQRC